MKRRLCYLPIAVVASVILGAGQALAYQKDPDITNPTLGAVTSTVTQLLAPDPTLGDLDTTVVGAGSDAVGIDDSLTNPPPDPADSSPGNVFFVDNTPNDGDCPQATFTTIQAAVNASMAGDTVQVCPGTYEEQVRILGHMHDGLKLESLVPLQAVIKWPTSETAPFALVDFNMVNNVDFRGFTATGPFPFPASTDRHEGLLVEDAFNERIHHNHITMIENVDPTLRGDQEGDAVAIGHRTLTENTSNCGAIAGSAQVDHNQIDNYQKNGVQVVNSGTSAVVNNNMITGSGTVTNVSQTAAENGVVAFCNAAAKINHNVISQNLFAAFIPPTCAPNPACFVTSTGIIIDQAPSGTSMVDHNRVFDNAGGIEADSEANLEISHNDVLQNTSDAIVVCGEASAGCGAESGIVVRANNIQNNQGSGIFLQGATANLVKANQIDGNGTASPPQGDQYGIHADSQTNGNEILSNQLQGNSPFDCKDDSGPGSGTDGTNNTWQNNHGTSPATQPDLCT